MTKKQRGGGGGVSGMLNEIIRVPEDPVERFVHYAMTHNTEMLSSLFEITEESKKKELCLSAFKLLLKKNEKDGIQTLLTICKSSIDDTMMSQYLNFAIDEGSINIVNLLLTNGAQIELTTAISGFTSLYRAVKSGSIKIVDILLKNGAKPSIDIIDTSQLYSCLHLAVLNNSNKIIKLLLDNGADINSKDIKLQAPLHFAVSQGSLEIVKLLIKSGADISSKTKNGQTPLHIATMKYSLDMVKLLIDNKADVSSINNFGQTPLHIATIHGSLYMVKLLIDSGAEISPSDDYGHTPEDYAIHNDNPNQKLINYFKSFKGLPVIAESDEVSLVPIKSQIAEKLQSVFSLPSYPTATSIDPTPTSIDPTPGGKVTKKFKKINRRTKTKSRLLNKKRRSYKKK
uniref:Uncharacterized protein n=1 Tax=viral metagenome TaxID=1070528 RepID=A0A6C0B7C7_9ZZZZ